MVEGLKFVLTLPLPENAFGDVIECNAVLKAIFHWNMLSGIVEGPKFVFTLTISENAFEAILDCNAYLESIL